MRNLKYINAKQNVNKGIFNLNDIKTILLRVHVNLRIYIQPQEEVKLARHGSHENTIEKELTTTLQEIFPR